MCVWCVCVRVVTIRVCVCVRVGEVREDECVVVCVCAESAR